MRVVLVNDHLHGGGAEVHVHALVALLRSAGHEVHLIADRPRPIHYVSRLFNPWLAWVLWREFRRIRPDVVHVHKFNLVWSIAPFLAGRLLGIPVVATLHDCGLVCPDGWGLDDRGQVCQRLFGGHCFGLECGRSRNGWKWSLYRRYNFVRNAIHMWGVRRWVDRTIAPSGFLTEWAGRFLGERSFRLPLFVEAPPSCPEPPSPEGPLRLFFAGRIQQEKGLQFLLEAMAGRNVSLRVAGDGSYLAALRTMAVRLGVRVEWLGSLDGAGVAREIATSEVCVLPSLWVENTPVFAFEAMRGARALLASRVGGFPDLITDGVNGLLAVRENAASLGEALDRLASDRALAAAMGKAGWARLREEWTAARHLRELENHYRAVMRGGR